VFVFYFFKRKWLTLWNWYLILFCPATTLSIFFVWKLRPRVWFSALFSTFSLLQRFIFISSHSYFLPYPFGPKWIVSLFKNKINNWHFKTLRLRSESKTSAVWLSCRSRPCGIATYGGWHCALCLAWEERQRSKFWSNNKKKICLGFHNGQRSIQMQQQKAEAYGNVSH